MKIKELWNGFLDLLFPEFRCVVCGREAKDTETKLCENCKKSFPKIEGHICAKCGAPLPEHDYICDTCRNAEYHFDEARSSFLYTKETSRLFFGIKYSGKKYVAKFLASQMAETLKSWGVACDIIVPVPLTEKRRKVRGYNQSLLIADELSRLTGIEVCDNVVERIKDVSAQTSLSRKERIKNLDGVFRRVPKTSLKGKRVLIVDDVFTTGATASAVAKEIRKMKADKIYVLTAGKTVYYNQSSENATRKLKQKGK